MQNKNLIVVLVAVSLAIAGLVYWGLNQPQVAVAPTETAEQTAENVDSDIIYYYGAECPHCQDLSRFLEENKIAEKVNFAKKEVWHNQANSEELKKKGGECGIIPEGMGVPLVYARGKCYIGTPEAEKFFRQEAGI